MTQTLQPENRVMQLISSRTYTPLPQIKIDSRLFEDIGMDSMDILSIGADMEREFGIMIVDEEIQRVKTVNDLVLIAVNKLNPING